MALLDEEVRAQRDNQVRHFEALDGRAGAILGFAGLLVALAQGARGGLAVAARIVAAAAALAALWALLPRRLQEVDVAVLRGEYGAAEPAFTELKLFDLRLEMTLHGYRLIRTRSSRLLLSVAILATAVVLLTLSGVLN